MQDATLKRLNLPRRLQLLEDNFKNFNLSDTKSAYFIYLGCVSLGKSGKIGFLNPKESENGFCVFLLNRSIQDFSDDGASKEPKNPLPEWILRFL